ncbi:MAG: Ig-like domain-containing protein, partial [Pseudomonadota bacterium]
ITITASDGKASATIGPFDLSVLLPEVPATLEVRSTIPSTYVWDSLSESKPVYVDRPYTFSSVPDEFDGLQYLMTANDDKRETANPFVRFEVNKRVTVYVGYDVRASELPDWLADWTATGESWQTTDTTFDVYSREFDVGTVGLGGNDGAQSMYSVVIEAQDDGLPIAAADSAQTQEDTPVSVDVLSNDIGLVSTPLQVFVVTPPENGTATPTAFNTVYYVPEDRFVGTDTFEYAVADANGASSTATVTITVMEATQGATPVSFDDSYEVLQGTTLTMNVLDNDTGLFDAPLVVTVESPTANGSVTVVAGNAIEYTSDPGYVGSDALTYRVTDADGDFDTGSVSITVLSVNAAPTISGTPATTVVVGDGYSFTPTAFDADGDSLTFSIANEPAWASFDPGTGALTGTPQAGDTGTTSGIVVSVTDGEDTTALDAFSVTVVQAASGSATISWDPPTQSTDGSPLNDLAGYRVYYGTSPGSYSNQVEANNPGLSSLVVDNLPSGTWYFVTTAFDTAGNESAYSNVASKTIP